MTGVQTCALPISLLNAPAQTVLHERAPAEMRGRIFTTQVVSANFFSLLPLLLIGAITDIVGISWVLIILALLVSGASLLNAEVVRRMEAAAGPQQPLRPTARGSSPGDAAASVDVDTRKGAKLE